MPIRATRAKRTLKDQVGSMQKRTEKRTAAIRRRVGEMIVNLCHEIQQGGDV